MRTLIGVVGAVAMCAVVGCGTAPTTPSTDRSATRSAGTSSPGSELRVSDSGGGGGGLCPGCPPPTPGTFYVLPPGALIRVGGGFLGALSVVGKPNIANPDGFELQAQLQVVRPSTNDGKVLWAFGRFDTGTLDLIVRSLTVPNTDSSVTLQLFSSTGEPPLSASGSPRLLGHSAASCAPGDSPRSTVDLQGELPGLGQTTINVVQDYLCY